MRTLILLTLLFSFNASAQLQFAVAGDSRNCGDVVMPAIAQSVRNTNAQFYWHLGDFRWLLNIDQDMLGANEVKNAQRPADQQMTLSIRDYNRNAWPDFIASQVNPFGTLPVYLGVGNHELYEPKTRNDWITQFGDWLTKPNIVAQRLADDPNDHVLRTYYHWIQNGVDFINTDNAEYTYDSAQLRWLKDRFEYDKTHPEITAVVIGGHGALPHSLSCDHSMNETANGERSGVTVYKQLLELMKAGKKVYSFASHSHFKLENVYDTEYWRANGGVVPGWIAGTAGATRYRLPDTTAGMPVSRAQTDVYGYYLVTIAADGSATAEFHEVKRAHVPAQVEATFGKKTVDACFAGNSDFSARVSKNCASAAVCGMP